MGSSLFWKKNDTSPVVAFDTERRPKVAVQILAWFSRQNSEIKAWSFLESITQQSAVPYGHEKGAMGSHEAWGAEQ